MPNVPHMTTFQRRLRRLTPTPMLLQPHRPRRPLLEPSLLLRLRRHLLRRRRNRRLPSSLPLLLKANLHPSLRLPPHPLRRLLRLLHLPTTLRPR